MKKVIKGKTYNTETSLELKKKKSEIRFGSVIHKTISFLYETRTGNYFISYTVHVYHTDAHYLDRTHEWIEPVTKDEAMKFLYSEG